MVRVAAAVEAGENLYGVTQDAEKQPIGKSPEPGSAHVAFHGRELVRILRKPFSEGEIFDHEAMPEAGALGIVPVLPMGQVALSLRRQGYPHQR
jgi:hypothetical protein